MNFFNSEDQLIFVVFLMLMGLYYPETIKEIDLFLPDFAQKWILIHPYAEIGGGESHF